MSGPRYARIPGLVDDADRFPTLVRRAVWWRARLTCERCGRFDELGIYTRRRDGGAHPPNAVILCTSCRDWLYSHRAHAHREGWAVLPGHDPETVPVSPYLTRRPVLLTRTGRYAKATKEIPA